MANHASAEKRIRQTEKRTAVNRARRSRIRTFVKSAETAIEAGKKDAAITALRDAQSELLRGVSKGIVTLGTASRKISRLAARVKQLSA